MRRGRSCGMTMDLGRPNSTRVRLKTTPAQSPAGSKRAAFRSKQRAGGCRALGRAEVRLHPIASDFLGGTTFGPSKDWTRRSSSLREFRQKLIHVEKGEHGICRIQLEFAAAPIIALRSLERIDSTQALPLK